MKRGLKSHGRGHHAAFEFGERVTPMKGGLKYLLPRPTCNVGEGERVIPDKEGTETSPHHYRYDRYAEAGGWANDPR